MRFEPEIKDGANAGLGIEQDILKPVKQAFPEESVADIWALAGAAAVEFCGGPEIEVNLGRTDATSGAACPVVGRLPDAAQGAQHLRDVFYRMGFNDQEIVCLSGAHAVGRCHTDRSGFWGPWTYGEAAFSNDYFKFLLEKKWTPKTTHEGKAWKGPKQFEADNGKLMMLPTDMVLLDDPSFKKWVKVYAGSEEKFFADFAVAFQKLTELGFKQ